MDFELTETQLMLQAMAREFAEKQIKPVAQEFDRKADPCQCFPLELYRQGFALDLHKMVIPEKHGGMGLDCLSACLILEELAAADAGYAVTWHVNNIALTFMYNRGTEQQALEFIQPIMGPEPGVAGLSTCEPDGGTTSVGIVYPTSMLLKTTALPDGDQLAINGAKAFCSNGGLPFSKWVLVSCRTDMTKVGSESTGLIIVPLGIPGFEVSEEDKMGLRLSSTAELSFSDARVPARNHLQAGVRTITYDHDAAIATVALGIARSAYEAALEFAQTRIVLDKPIIKYQLIQTKIADMWMALEASRCLIWRVATYADTHPEIDMKLARAVKVFVTDAAIKVVDSALQVFGGLGYMKDTVVEKCYRDVRAMPIVEGTNEVLRLSLANFIDAGM